MPNTLTSPKRIHIQSILQEITEEEKESVYSQNNSQNPSYIHTPNDGSIIKSSILKSNINTESLRERKIKSSINIDSRASSLFDSKFSMGENRKHMDDIFKEDPGDFVY